MWVIGIDEAGYGPNLGPLVQAAVAVRLSATDPAGWDTLKPLVRRCHEKGDDRLLIDDSKKVYTRGGLGALERGVWCGHGLTYTSVDHLIFAHAPWSMSELHAEMWYAGTEPLPVETWEPAAVALPGIQGLATITPPSRFNRICDETGTKGAVLGRGVTELLSKIMPALPRDGLPVAVQGDKLGGRNYYAALLQEAFPNGWVVTERESTEESRYRVEQLDRAVTIAFRPRADAGSVAVALASMLCKYLREVCMRQFNRFWAQHVPGIRPTAGYPVDAKRFYAEIREAMSRLGLTDDQVWRRR